MGIGKRNRGREKGTGNNLRKGKEGKEGRKELKGKTQGKEEREKERWSKVA